MVEMSRPEIPDGAVFAPVDVQAWGSHAGEEAKESILFVGTRTVNGSSSQGIYSYRWDPAAGELHSHKLAVVSENPTFLATDSDARYLYAANELQQFEGNPGGAVSAFAVDRSTATLRFINQVASLGAGTCYVTVDNMGNDVFCANYVGGSSSSFLAASDGRISNAVAHFQYRGHGPNRARQASPHAHRVTVSPENRFLLVNDLGLDCIHIYHLDAASAHLTLNDPPLWQAAPGSGPRALRFHPSQHIAYCVCEMGSEVYVLDWNHENGTLHELQRLSLVPRGYGGPTRGSDIVLNRTGTFAYIANRDYNCLNTFAVDSTAGTLSLLHRGSCGGKIPRHLALDPTERWLLVANQDSECISVFARDANTGMLVETGRNYPAPFPQCLVFA
jgi:6-phosphogluconolactonase